MNKIERAIDAIRKALDDATLGLSDQECKSVLEETSAEVDSRIDGLDDDMAKVG